MRSHGYRICRVVGQSCGLRINRSSARKKAPSATDLHGFSVLHGNAKTGEYVCDVHVVRMRGALVDNDRTVTFGHEVLHCFGFRHE